MLPRAQYSRIPQLPGRRFRSVNPASDFTIILPPGATLGPVRNPAPERRIGLRSSGSEMREQTVLGASQKRHRFSWRPLARAGSLGVALFLLGAAVLFAGTRFTSSAATSTDETTNSACCVRDRYGTSVDFVPSQTDAAQLARRDKKLMFLLHVSGNFEEPGFT